MTETATRPDFSRLRLPESTAPPTVGKRAALPADEPDTASIKVSSPGPSVAPRRAALAAPAATSKPTPADTTDAIDDTFNDYFGDDENETSAGTPSGSDDFNPLLDDDDEDESQGVTAVTERSQSTNSSASGKVAATPAITSDDEADAKRAAAKARRAAKREQNHLEHPVWYRRRAGREDKDRDYLNFLARFKGAKAVHLAALHDVAKHTAYKRLKGLESYGFVREHKLYDQSSVWLLTAKGLDFTDYPDLSAVPKGRSLGDLNHDLVVAHVAANWAGGRFDVLDRGSEFIRLVSSDSKGKDAEDLFKRRYLSSRMVTEYQIRSEIGRIKLDVQAALGQASQNEVAARIQQRVHEGDWNWQDCEQVGRFALTIPEGSSIGGKVDPLYSDLVLVAPHPASSKRLKKVAVEVEMSHKANDRLREKLNAYRWDTSFDEVIYVVPEPALRRKVQRMGQEVGLENLRTIPLYVLDRDGERIEHNDSWIRF